jgi:hypothetical protein
MNPTINLLLENFLIEGSKYKYTSEKVNKSMFHGSSSPDESTVLINPSKVKCQILMFTIFNFSCRTKSLKIP